jgi:hypothetical protein
MKNKKAKKKNQHEEKEKNRINWVNSLTQVNPSNLGSVP